MIGLERGTVRVAPYQPEWQRLFEDEAQLLRSVLRPSTTVEHVGSTAVEGMPAKPLIDLMVGVDDMRTAHELAPALERAAYNLGEVTDPRRPLAPVPYLLFVKGPDSRRTHHLRLSERFGPDWTDQLLCRDYLRTHPAAAREYAELKEALAAKHPGDRAAYRAGKDRCIRRLLELARTAAEGAARDARESQGGGR